MVDVGLTVILFEVEPLLQETELLQFETVNVADSPAQIVAEFTLGVGFGVTVTLPVA